MRVLVCGGRDYTDHIKVISTLIPIFSKEHGGTGELLVVGSRRGADGLALRFAEAFAIPTIIYFADWFKEGKSAGPKRNQRMLGLERPGLVVAFPGGRGTADMVRRAKKANVQVIEVT